MATAACGGAEPIRHEIVPLVLEDCAIPADVRELVIYALGDFAPSDETAQNGPVDAALTIDKFPPTTAELAVELLGPGQVVRAHGRSGRFDLDTLAAEDRIHIFVAPPRSFCRVGAPSTPRSSPLLALSGGELLILGGYEGAAGPPADTAEVYDPRTGTLSMLADAPYFDLSGARAVTLPDDRVLLVWEGTYQIWDPRTQTFGPPTVPEDPDVLLHDHAAVTLLPDGRVFVAGGGEDGPSARADVSIFDPVTDLFAAAPPLARQRAGGTAVPALDGGVWLFGHFAGDSGETLEHWTPEQSEVISIDADRGAPLHTGGLFLERDGGARFVVSSAGAITTLPSTAFPGRVSFTPLADGAVLVVGLDIAWIFSPHDGSFEEIQIPFLDDRHGTALLPDGTVALVADEVLLYRHDLDGPFTNPPTQVFTGPDAARFVVPDDLGNARLEEDPPRMVLGGDAPRAVLGAVELGELDARIVAASEGAVQVSLGGGALVIDLEPGAPARAGSCTGEPVSALTPGTPHDIVLAARDGRLTVSLDETPLLDCATAAPHGRVAISATAELTLYAITVTR